MLVRLMYASRAAEALRPDALNALLKQSMQQKIRESNSWLHIQQKM